MNKSDQNSTVYSHQVIEFVAVAKELCNFFEHAQQLEKTDFIIKSHKFLSLIYLKALALPKTEQINEDGNEKFVTELDWTMIKDNVSEQMGSHDSYIDFFDHLMQETSEPVTCSVSENIADIYQDLKDFLSVYQLAITDIMNDALVECLNNFEQYWGQRVLASVKHLHHEIYITGIDTENETKGEPSLKTKDWFIAKRQQEFNNGSGLS